jgi:hypothetical protein
MNIHYFIQTAQQLLDQATPTTSFIPNGTVAKSQQNKNSLRSGTTRLFISLILLLAMQGMAWGAIEIRGGAANYTTGSGAASVVINKPASVVAGDVMIVNLSSYGGSNNWTLLSGWTSISNVLMNSTNRYAAVFYRVVDGTEGSSFTFSITGGANSAGAIVAFSGVDAVNPLGATIQPISTGGGTTAITATTITTTTANAAVIMFGMCSNNPFRTFSGWTTATSPGTLTEIYDFGGVSYESVGAAWATKATAGATGAGSATLNAAGSNFGGILIALKAAVPTITSLGASSGCVGSSLVITGTNLTGATSATIGGTAATITGNTETTVTVTVGSGTTGTVAVTTPGGTATSAATFTVNANNTVSDASSSPTPCINTVMTSITHTTTGAKGISAATGLPAGVTAAWATNTITISGTPTASGTFNYSIPLSGGCGSVINATGTIIVNPSPSASVSGKFNITCHAANDGKIEVTASGGTGPYTFSVETPENFLPPTGANLRLFEGLLPDVAYRIKVKDHNGCISK